ncbi:MAG: hypothetical protein HY343_04335 [Lentisphaerae bacterium]|nr:hypothetical protein [Lentisphaerota bacterium]
MIIAITIICTLVFCAPAWATTNEPSFVCTVGTDTNGAPIQQVEWLFQDEALSLTNCPVWSGSVVQLIEEKEDRVKVRCDKTCLPDKDRWRTSILNSNVVVGWLSKSSLVKVEKATWNDRKRNAQPEAAETITGLVVEMRASVKSAASWNAPSDPYYVLKTDNQSITLRPSETVSRADLAGLTGKRVFLRGRHTEGEPYKPSHPGEQYPMEPEVKIGTNGVPEFVKLRRPINRGSGFVVTKILEMKQQD